MKVSPTRMLLFLPLQLQKRPNNIAQKETNFCLLHEGTPSGVVGLVISARKEYYSIHLKT